MSSSFPMEDIHGVPDEEDGRTSIPHGLINNQALIVCE